VPRYYSGSYYGPRVLPKPEGPGLLPTFVGAGIGLAIGGPAGALEGARIGARAGEGDIAGALEEYATNRLRAKADARADEEYEYRKGRRETIDPLEEALLRRQLYESGVVPQDGGPGLSDMIEQPDRGADLLAGRAQFGDQGIGGTGFRREESRVGLFSPGSFNPNTGTFNPVNIDPGFTAPHFGPERDIDPGFTAPGQRRIPLGGGYELDPSRTKEGRARAAEQELIDALVGSGVDRGHAMLDVRGNEGVREHTHPGAWQPRTMEEYRSAHAPAPERPKNAQQIAEDEALGEALYQVRSQPAWKPGSLVQYLGSPAKFGRRLSPGQIQGIVAEAFKQRESSDLARYRTDPYGEMGGGGGAVDQQRAAWDAAAQEIKANPRKYGNKSPEDTLGPRP
jgi:hypothetical protein